MLQQQAVRLQITVKWQFLLHITNATQCSCCHKIHNPKKKEEQEGDAAAGRAGKKKDDAKDAPNEHGFTAEEDAIIAARKEGSKWQDTVDEVNALGKERSKSQCQDRAKELKAAAASGEKQDDAAEKNKKDDKQDSNEKKGNKKKGGKGEQTEEQKAKAERDRAEGLARSAAKKAGKAVDQVIEEKKEEIKDEVKAAAEAAKVCSRRPGTCHGDILISKQPAEAKTATDDRQKWIAAASKHFDRTGHRITPEQAKKMAEESK